MAEVTVLRVEVSGSSGTDSKSLTTTAAVASGIGRKTTGGTPSPEETINVLSGRKGGQTPKMRAIGRTEGRQKMGYALGIPVQGLTLSNKGTLGYRTKMFGQGVVTYAKNIEYKQLGQRATRGATALVGAQALYSQYRSTGMQLSGSSHAAAQQQRKTQRLGMATGIGVAVASGRPEAVVLMIAARAWQMSQQNRQTLFRLQADQMTSNILQQRLVKNTIERRF
jgi:hypothetical protein